MRHQKGNYKTVLYILPALIIFAVFVFWPMIYTLYLSFFDWNMIRPTKNFVGFENYINIFTDKDSYSLLMNTFLYVLLLMVFNFIVPYIMAFILGYIIPKFKDFFKAAFFLPSFISLVVGSMIYTWILNPISGPLAEMVANFNIKLPNWTTTEGLVIFGICLITAWQVFGYHFITLYAAVTGIDNEIIENAQLDGISSWRVFKDIVAPMSSATGLYVLIMSIVTGLQFVYTPISVVTQGGPNGASSNIIYESYREAFLTFNTGTASALSVLTTILFGILLIILLRNTSKAVYYEN